MKFYYILSFVCLISLGVLPEVSAQSRKVGTKSRESKTTEVETTEVDKRREEKVAKPFMQSLNSDIKVGNLQIQGNIFSIALKASSGYKITDALSAGIAAKGGTVFFNSAGQSQDQSIYYYGFGPYARARIFQQVYLQVEYDYNNLPESLDTRTALGSAYLGGGFMQGWGDWKFGAEVLFIMNDKVRDYNGIVEYWIGGSYNF
jgi:hypothetical protein